MKMPVINAINPSRCDRGSCRVSHYNFEVSAVEVDGVMRLQAAYMGDCLILTDNCRAKKYALCALRTWLDANVPDHGVVLYRPARPGKCECPKGAPGQTFYAATFTMLLDEIVGLTLPAAPEIVRVDLPISVDCCN